MGGASARSRLARAAIALACILLLAGMLFSLARTVRGRSLLHAAISRLSGYDIAAASIDVSPGLTVRATDVSVASAAAPPFFRAREIVADFSLGSLLRGRTRLLEARGFEVSWSRLPGGNGGGAGRAPFEELRLTEGAIRDLAGPAAADVRIPSVVLARRDGGDFDVKGSVLAPARSTALEWTGHADPSGKRLLVRGRGEVGDVGGLLADFGFTSAPASSLESARLALRLRGDLYGAVRARIRARGRAQRLSGNARVRGKIATDDDRETLTINLAARAADIVPLRVDGAVRRDDSTSPLDLHVSWRHGALAPVRSSLADPPQWLPRDGTASLVADVSGPLAAPRIDAHFDATGLSFEGEGFAATTNANMSVRFEDGVLRSSERAAVLQGLALRVGSVVLTAARAAANLRIDRQSDAAVIDLADVVVAGAGAHDEEQILQAAGVEVAGHLHALVPDGEAVKGAVKLTAKTGEVLYDRAYLNLGEYPLEISTSLRNRDDALEVESFSVDLARMGRLEGKATFRNDLSLTRLDARADVPSIDVAFDRLVRETFQDALPFLAATKVSGTLGAKVDYRRSGDAWRSTGRVTLAKGALEIADPSVQMANCDLDVPFDVATGSAGVEPGSGIEGRVRTGDVRIGGLQVAPVELPLVARTNELGVAQPIDVPFAGGGLRIDDLRAYDLSSGSPAADAHVKLERMQLDALTAAAGLPTVRGTVAGDLGRVTLADARITSDGRVVLETLGGSVALTNLGVDDVFSPVPALLLDAEVTGIDLRQATESLGVGYISGVARAKVVGLEIAAGQPVGFDAEFETVPARGVAQRVSVTAIQQLTILGGADAGSLTRGILGLFDEYRYAKMGFRCSLKNDRFILHGIAEHDGKDFLVVGTLLPPTVNVISHNQVIAFKEMVKRLQRITAAGEGKVRVESNP